MHNIATWQESVEKKLNFHLRPLVRLYVLIHPTTRGYGTEETREEQKGVSEEARQGLVSYSGGGYKARSEATSWIFLCCLCYRFATASPHSNRANQEYSSPETPVVLRRDVNLYWLVGSHGGLEVVEGFLEIRRRGEAWRGAVEATSGKIVSYGTSMRRGKRV